MAAPATPSVERLLESIAALTAQVVALSKELADLKRAGYEPPPPVGQITLGSDDTLPEKIRDAIASRAIDRPGRVYLEDYARRRLRETDGDEDVVLTEVLEGEDL